MIEFRSTFRLSKAHLSEGALPFSLTDEGNGIMSVQLSRKVDYEVKIQYSFSVEVGLLV